MGFLGEAKLHGQCATKRGTQGAIGGVARRAGIMDSLLFARRCGYGLQLNLLQQPSRDV